MADILKGLTAEQLERRIELLESVRDREEEISQITRNRFEVAERTVELLAREGNEIQRLIEAQEAQKAAVDEGDDEQIAKFDRKIADLEALQNRVNSYRDENSEFFKDLSKQIDDTVDGKRALIGAAVDVSKKLRETSKALFGDIKKESTEYETMTTPQLLSTIGDVASGAARAAYGVLTEVSAQTAAIGILMRGIGFDVVAAKMAAIPTQMDTSFRDIMKGGSKFSTELQNSFVAAFDPLGAERMGLISDASGEMLVNVGLTAQEVGTALTELRSNAMLFRTSFFIEQPEIAAQTANMVAGLKKIGVPMGTTAKIIDQFTMAMKQTPAEANKSVKKLVNIADSLDINVGTALKDANYITVW